MNSFIPICKDLFPTVFSFLLYTESISLQKCSSFSLKQKEKMEKYCQHIQPHGKIELYDKKTKLILSEKNYKEGKLNGKQKHWYGDIPFLSQVGGQLNYEKNYKNGKEEGIQKWWYIDGQLMYEYNYKEEKLEGKQKYWYSNGQIWHERNYYKGDNPSSQGKEEGIQKCWYEDGQLWYEVIYKQGKHHGIKKEWYKNGKRKL